MLDSRKVTSADVLDIIVGLFWGLILSIFFWVPIALFFIR